MERSVRPATKEDMPQILKIYEYYVLNTVISFLIKPPPLEYLVSRYEASLERNLPYLVAVEQSQGEEKIIGYTYASAFRGFMLGYGHTVEMTIFVAPGYTDQGIGSMMMRQILYILRKAKHHSKEAGHENGAQEFEIRNVLAIMSVDDLTPKKGLELRNWYMKWGFEEVGRLKGVGFKFGRRLDTMYLELRLT